MILNNDQQHPPFQPTSTIIQLMTDHIWHIDTTLQLARSHCQSSNICHHERNFSWGLGQTFQIYHRLSLSIARKHDSNIILMMPIDSSQLRESKTQVSKDSSINQKKNAIIINISCHLNINVIFASNVYSNVSLIVHSQPTRKTLQPDTHQPITVVCICIFPRLKLKYVRKPFAYSFTRSHS